MCIRDRGDTAYEFENRKSVVLVIGVNGVGKTTSVGKLAGKLKDQGKKVIVAAADTYRAAAGEQLTEWAPVSYTHLDVYKRQYITCGGTRYDKTTKDKLGPFNKLLVESFFVYNKSGERLRRRKRMKEDVYKRQL